MTTETKAAPEANGQAPAAEDGYLSAAAMLENAPADLEELDVTGVFGGKVRIRALTAAQAALVRKATVDTSGRSPQVVWDAMERKQFQFGVIDPPLSAEQVRTLHTTSGRSFARVIAEIDRISAMDKEAMRDAQKEFPGPDDR